jgi:hypothetical protein
VQLDGFRVGAAVARDDLQLRDRYVELGAGGVFEVEEFRVALAEIHVQQAQVAADAVAFMHHGSPTRSSDRSRSQPSRLARRASVRRPRGRAVAA